MGEGIAFVKLWPLNPSTGARSRSIRTGFTAPTINDLASRVSPGGGGLDIEILVGQDGVDAVRKAEAAAEAKVTTAAADEASPACVPGLTTGMSDETSTAERMRSPTDEASPPSPAAVPPSDLPADPFEPACDAADGTATVKGPVDEAVALAPAGGEEAAPPRWLALEVEMFACGYINVSYMMDLVKVCFEQVRYAFGQNASTMLVVRSKCK